MTNKVFWKEGDDLRLDRVVLFMLDVFNGIWREACVRYLPRVALEAQRGALGRVSTARAADDHGVVQAVTYRIANADFSHGFVECLVRAYPRSHARVRLRMRTLTLPALGCSRAAPLRSRPAGGLQRGSRRNTGQGDRVAKVGVPVQQHRGSACT